MPRNEQDSRYEESRNAQTRTPSARAPTNPSGSSGVGAPTNESSPWVDNGDGTRSWTHTEVRTDTMIRDPDLTRRVDQEYVRSPQDLYSSPPGGSQSRTRQSTASSTRASSRINHSFARGHPDYVFANIRGYENLPPNQSRGEYSGSGARGSSSSSQAHRREKDSERRR